MRASFITADVFTHQMFGGNQLAVFPEAGKIPPDLFQSIAREFNYSETTFVFPPDNPAYGAKVRIFAPAAEMPFAGHPTIGTAHVLASIGAIPSKGVETSKTIFEEPAGPVEVTIRSRDGKPVFAELASPTLPEVAGDAPMIHSIAKMLTLEEEALIANGLEPVIMSGGTPFLLVPVCDEKAIRRIRLRSDRYDSPRRKHISDKVLVYSLNGSRVHARMFAPAIGISEDPATGSAAVALGGYLATRNPMLSGLLKWTIEQGGEIGRPSLLEVEADKRDGVVIAVRVGGYRVIVSEGTMTI